MKPIFKSKTFWANVMSFVAVFAATKGIPLDPDTQAQIVAGGMAAANIALRLITKQPASLTGK